MGVCCSTLSFSDNDVGEMIRDNAYNDTNLEVTERITKELFAITTEDEP